MTYYRDGKTVIDALTETQIGIFPTIEQAELFIRSVVGCEESAGTVAISKCEKIANKIAMLTETHKMLPDGSWVKLKEVV